MRELFTLVDKLSEKHSLEKSEYQALIAGQNGKLQKYAAEKAVKLRKSVYGNDVYIRGLIEVGNICRNDCLYCGIRRSNKSCERYSLSDGQILACCAEGYALGFRTFVLQGGEGIFQTERVCRLVKEIKARYPDCAVTLSLGEYEYEGYLRMFEAGADRYLLRHETADEAHYNRLHPAEMSFKNRMRCLRDLKTIGFQTGCGFMVGSPYQTAETLAKDLKFIEEFSPEMCGIGPFIPQKDTPFGNESAGTAEQTLAFAFADKAHPAEHPAARHHGAEYRSSKRTGTRHFSRSKRHYAQSFPRKRTQKIRALRQQGFERRGVGAGAEAARGVYGKHRLPYCHRQRRHYPINNIFKIGR